MTLLIERFVSTWNLIADLKALQKDESDPLMSTFATMILNEYEFPVMMMIIAPNGTIVHKLNANKFMDAENSFIESGLNNPATYQYEKFLKEGLTKLEEAPPG